MRYQEKGLRMDKLTKELNKLVKSCEECLDTDYEKEKAKLISQARQAILDLVPGERIKQGKQNNSRFNHGVTGFNQSNSQWREYLRKELE